ncbi:MAG: AMP-binding protein [Rhizobiales bacterium]|nr:AMP-binding protein [Hyphomicrobiales bacterium]
MHPADMIFFWAEMYPHHPALLQPNASLTYRELAIAITGISQRTDALKLPKDEPVAVAIDEPMRRLAVCFALLRRGIPVAPIRPTMLPLMRANGIPNTIYTGHGQVLSGGRNIRFEESWLRLADGPVERWNPGDASLAADTSQIFFTSGTTGVPKKVVVPGAAIMERVALLGYTAEALTDRTLVVPGVSSWFGFSRTAQLMHAGRTVCTAGDIEGTLRMIDLFEVETIIASPQQILALVNAVDANPALQPASLQQVVMGGAFASPELFRRVQARLCRNVVYNYGSTEAGLVASGNYFAIQSISNAVGFPAPGITVEIVDEQGRPLPAGTPGRIRCRTNYFAAGYIAAHPEARDDVETIWWYPGDNGLLTEGGVLCVLGRTDDVVNIGGTKVAGALLDEAAQRTPGVSDAGVCGVPGSSGIEELWVAVVLDRQANIADVRQALSGRAEFAGVQFNMVAVDELPRNDLGKLERYKIKQLLVAKMKQP